MPTLLHRPYLPFAFAVLVFVAASSRAEDIDIFSGIDAQNELPNVLIVWDSSANWGSDINVPNCSYSDGSGGPKATAPNKEQGKKFAIEKCAIYNVIVALPLNDDGTARFNVGLMLFNESGAAQGGYPRKQFLPLTAANKTLLLNTIRNIAVNDDKANNGPYSQAMQEAYLMFARKAPYRGTLGTKVIICRPGDPEAKGLVERVHDYLERAFLPGRRFTGPVDFNAQLQNWVQQAKEAVRNNLYMKTLLL